VESLFGVVRSAVSNFSLVHSILSASVPLDDAHDDEDEQEKGNGQHHSYEPASCGHSVFGLDNGTCNLSIAMSDLALIKFMWNLLTPLERL
jgi:hypothetical protein